MRKPLFLFVLITALFCAGAPVQGKPRNFDDRLIDRVIVAIHQHHLTSVRTEALMFSCADSNDGKFREVDVRENHAVLPKTDPNTAPRLFTVRVDKRTGALSTDATHVDGKIFVYDGDYRPLPG